MKRVGGCLSLLILSCGFALGQASTKVLYNFAGPPDVGNPSPSPLVSDSAGNLYGVTDWGGTQYGGGVFELSPNPDGSWTESLLYNFCPDGNNCPDGSSPSGLVVDKNGNLFGIASHGGTSNGGVMFELSPPLVPGGPWNYSILYNFDGQPYGVPTFDKAGNIYGTMLYGSLPWNGNVWELSPTASGWIETILYTFCSLPNCADGESPETGVVFDSLGNLYGTTLFGGTGKQDQFHNTGGTLYELSPGTSGWTEKVLVNFPLWGSNNESYLGPASVDPLGNVYTTFTVLSLWDHLKRNVAGHRPARRGHSNVPSRRPTRYGGAQQCIRNNIEVSRNTVERQASRPGKSLPQNVANLSSLTRLSWEA